MTKRIAQRLLGHGRNIQHAPMRNETAMSDWWIVRPAPCGPSGCMLTIVPRGRIDMHSNPMVIFKCRRFWGPSAPVTNRYSWSGVRRRRGLSRRLLDTG